MSKPPRQAQVRVTIRASQERPPHFLLLTRPGCHLCEEFREALETAFPGQFELREACVDERPEWRLEFGREIPVLLDTEGRAVCRSRFEAGAIEAYLHAKKTA